MTGEALALVLAPAAGIALSPFAIIPAILILFAPRARAAGAAFIAGWFVALSAIAALFGGLSDRVGGGESAPDWAGPARVALGLVLLGLALKLWLDRRTPRPQPAMLAAIQSASPPEAARFGLMLAALNPKILLMAGSAGLTIGTATARPGEAVPLILLFAALASTSVALPWLVTLAAGEAARPALVAAQAFLERHNDALTAAVLAILGALLLLKGLANG